jgi:cell division protein ZapA (FtsZ GTPase activity inhibitor)
MTTLQININNKNFPVECEESQVELLKKAAESLKDRFNDLKKYSPTATSEYILFLCALSLESESLSTNKTKTELNSVDMKNLEDALKNILSLAENLKKNFIP